jgi:hypothetical protein
MGVPPAVTEIVNLTDPRTHGFGVEPEIVVMVSALPSVNVVCAWDFVPAAVK